MEGETEVAEPSGGCVMPRGEESGGPDLEGRNRIQCKAGRQKGEAGGGVCKEKTGRTLGWILGEADHRCLEFQGWL